MSNALLRFLPLSLAILSFSRSTNGNRSSFATCLSASQISDSDGAATLTRSVRLRIGAMIFAVEFANRINRRFGLYFSIVRLNAACASRVRWSASLMTTTLNRCFAFRSTCCVCATSFNKSCTTTRSKLPTSEGVISKWKTEDTMLNSSLRLEEVVKTRASILIFSTPGPNSSRRVATIRVFLPAPEGP
jgi:hypothetical protein